MLHEVHELAPLQHRVGGAEEKEVSLATSQKLRMKVSLSQGVLHAALASVSSSVLALTETLTTALMRPPYRHLIGLKTGRITCTAGKLDFKR